MHQTSKDNCTLVNMNPKPVQEIVITGMSGKFPNCNNVYQLRDNLYDKKDLVSEDDLRWKPNHPEIPRRAGKLYNVEKFDNGYFGIPKVQSDFTDPMLRMVLEKVYEAIVDAGYHPFDLEGTTTGVFVGPGFAESENSSYYNSQVRNAYAISGSQRSMIAKRINYFYKLNGPSFTSDTGCSSALYALEQACAHLKNGVCDKAIVCGTQLCLLPQLSLQFARLGVLSPEGKCKTFDSAANGYVRSEAIVVLLLEKYVDAKRVYAEIAHVKTKSDGFKEQGISFSSSDCQKELLKKFYEEVKVDPSTVTFIEAHGTGTPVGDVEELKAIDEIFCTGRTKPLLIGSIKSNIGHSEPASGLCAVVKVLIGMENGHIPPNINYKEPRKDAKSLETGRLIVVTENMAWPDEQVLVGVNSFGFGGANAHLLLKRHPKVKINNSEPRDNLPRLICVSGRTKSAVENIINDVASRKLDAEYIMLIHQVYRKNIPNHFFRGYCIVTKDKEIARAITTIPLHQAKLCLIFTNVDDAWFKMGKDLMSITVFAEAIERIHNVLHKKLSLNLTSILMSSNKENYINQVLGTVSVQLAITHVLKELNIKVDMMIGLGFGEFVCAYLDNFLTLEQVLLTAYYLADEFEKRSSGSAKKTMTNIVYEAEHKPNRWVPVYNRKTYSTEYNLYYPFGSVDYLTNNTSNHISLADCRKYMSPDQVVLVIGNEKRAKDNYIILRDENNPTMNLLDLLGKAYLKGVDMQLDNLYSRISLPVSRGTPMLSPLVKWDHKVNWRVTSSTKEKKFCYNVVTVEANTEEWRFITGHIVDGKNMFPASGYLTLVWECFAIMTGHSQEWSQMSIVFEDVNFSRVAIVPAEGQLTLVVVIQLGCKYFEVTENESVLVSGMVYESSQIHKFAELPSPVVDEDELILEGNDVYKELNLRGYQYMDQFRAIKKCNISGTNAIICWNDNWITFIDNFFHLLIFQEDTRNLIVPTSITKLIIDGRKHIKLASRYENKVPIVSNKIISLIRGGGIEMYGFGASSIPRKDTVSPVLETYKFIPYEGQLCEQDAVKCLVEIILENSTVTKVKAIEIYEDRLFMPLVQQTLADLPLIQPELIVLSNKPVDIPGVRVDNKQLNMQYGCLLVIATNILNNKALLKSALKSVRDLSGYVISYQTSNSTIPSTTTKVKLISSYDMKCGTLVLLQEVKQSTNQQRMVVYPSIENVSWIEPLKSMINSNQKIVLHCQNSELGGLLGLINCLRREPNGSNISAVILMDKAPQFDINNNFYKKQLDKNVAINVWKNGRWGSYRHLLMSQIELVESEHCFANVTAGDLSSLRWIQGPLTKNIVIQPESELVDIYYTAINLDNLRVASGEMKTTVSRKHRSRQECFNGIEFSGTDSSGRRVMGMASSSDLSTMVLADKQLLWSVPDEWTLEDAATVPVVYATVIYALLVKGDMRKGQSILIQCGTGGIGQAAINIATHHGCVIFTTVGSPEKKELIMKHFPQIKEEHIGDLRSTSFEEMVLRYTNGKGVDLVLNYLAEEHLQSSFRCLAPKGTFLKIGKCDLENDNKISVSLLKGFHVGIMLDHLIESDDIKRILSRLLAEGIRSGVVKPLSRTTFKTDEIETAFRYMATKKHMSKVLIKIRDECFSPRGWNTLFKALPRFYCKPDCSYIILGGLGGFGLELANWLVARGARKLVLTSRSGIKSGYQAYRLNIFKSYGARIVISNDDVASEQGCKDLLKAANALGPVDGVFNLAVVLQDALFENQSEEKFRTSLEPKAMATKNLDSISRVLCPVLRYFVVFSSVSCGRGNVGQTNYGMANSVMERICELRKENGYPALAIQWGAIGDVGLVAEMQENCNELVIRGTIPQRISSCLQLLDLFLNQGDTIVASMVVAETKTGAEANNVFDAVVMILGITNVAAVSMHATFPELGMDSMTAIEIKETLERECQVFLTAKDIRTMTLAKLKTMATEKVTPTKLEDTQREEPKVNHNEVKSFIDSTPKHEYSRLR